MRLLEDIQKIADITSEGLIVINMDGDFLFWNKEASHILGEIYPNTNVSWWKVYDTNRNPIPKEQTPFLRALEGEDVYGETLLFCNEKYPEGKYIRCWVKPVIEDDSQVGVSCSFIDVSNIEKQNRDLQEAVDELQQFAYAVSHDLREPLHKIQSFGSRLESQYKECLDETGVRYIQVMKSAAERMLQLIDALLEYGKVGQKRDNFEDVPINNVLDDVLESLSEHIQQDSTEIHVAEGLPTVFGDPHLLFILFMNLISNALKFKHNEHPTKILVSKEQSDDFLIVTVQDNGIGFDPEYRERIFKIFERLHSRFDYPGTGIGLALCKRIIDRHGGWITAESAQGKGATFKVGFLKRNPHA